MWREDPEQLLMMAKQHGAELRAEAAANRTARRAPDPDRFSGLKIRVGSVLIMVGRTFADENCPPEPVRS
jgi:hypothetical protein